jgi:Asp/Glu/hydantoin racemase
MRILLLNANTSGDMTTRLLAAARRTASPETELVGATGRFGGAYIGTRATYAIGAHAALDAYAECTVPCDAVLLACFGDPGLAALRELASVPVVGMAEASCMTASRRVGRFSIVTGGLPWVAMLSEYVANIGLADRLASIRAVPMTGAVIAADPDAHIRELTQSCIAAVRDDGAEAVILGGAGLAGFADRIADRVPAPLIDSLAAAIEATEAAARNHSGSVALPAGAGDGAPTTGLGSQLARLMSGRSSD